MALEDAATEFQKLQREYSKAISNREQLESQLRENELVHQEIAKVKEGFRVYKQIGPSMLHQEKNEALDNVSKRLDFIKSEIKRVETLLKDLEEKQEKKRAEIIKLQKK